ncbi:MAG: Ig domain-containing protein [Solobacterium sp.]|nr:Ig domain-containing protein [Solobacterium sp.]
MKKSLALLLSLFMAFNTSIPVFAENADEPQASEEETAEVVEEQESETAEETEEETESAAEEDSEEKEDETEIVEVQDETEVDEEKEIPLAESQMGNFADYANTFDYEAQYTNVFPISDSSNFVAMYWEVEPKIEVSSDYSYMLELKNGSKTIAGTVDLVKSTEDRLIGIDPASYYRYSWKEGFAAGNYEAVLGTFNKKTGEYRYFRLGTVSYDKGFDANRTYISCREGDSCVVDLLNGYKRVEFLEIYPPSLDVTKGTSGKIDCGIFPVDATNRTIYWSSSNTGVVGIDQNAYVTTPNVGSAVITAKSPDGPSRTCPVTVREQGGGVPVDSVSVSSTSVRLKNIGDTYKLAAIISPGNASNKNVTWSSNKPSVVTVDGNGTLRAVANGSAKVTVKTDDGGKTAVCTVRVGDGGIALEDIDVDPYNATIKVGQTLQLKVIYKPSDASDKKVTWDTSDPRIATVDQNGLVVGVSKGTAEITVKSHDGGYTDKCKVTVQSNYVEVEKVVLSQHVIIMNQGETRVLTATVLPTNAQNKRVVWSTENTFIAAVDQSGTVSAIKTGVTNIVVTSEDQQKTDTCTVVVRAETDKDHKYLFRMYNPNSGEHFYTSNEQEMSQLVTVGWKCEGYAFKAPVTSKTPMYRLYNPNAGDHHYTKSQAEAKQLVAQGWRSEGIAFYAEDGKDGVPQYRLYNPNATTGSHHYTYSAAERDSLVISGWKDEGIGFYTSK